MRVKVILNPYANRWQAGQRAAAVQAACTNAGLDTDLSVTTAPGEGIDLAEAAAGMGFDAVVAAGGDGSISEVANGLLRAAGGGPTVPLGIIPLGTANDFSDMVELPRNLEKCVAIVANGRTRQIDAGQVNDHFFVNNCAVAMEPMVTIENIKMTRLSGEVRYLVALVRAIVRIRAWDMQVVWEGGGHEGPTYLLSVCNTARTGGFYMAPEAEYNDGLLDFVLAPEVSKRTLLVTLGRLLRGTHVYHEPVTYGRATRLSVLSQPGTPIQADGEIIDEAAHQIDYQVLPGRLTLLSP